MLENFNYERKLAIALLILKGKGRFKMIRHQIDVFVELPHKKVQQVAGRTYLIEELKTKATTLSYSEFFTSPPISE